ncbi:uncharacterized protein FN964_010206 [Alca torda]
MARTARPGRASPAGSGRAGPPGPLPHRRGGALTPRPPRQGRAERRATAHTGSPLRTPQRSPPTSPTTGGGAGHGAPIQACCRHWAAVARRWGAYCSAGRRKAVKGVTSSFVHWCLSARTLWRLRGESLESRRRAPSKDSLRGTQKSAATDREAILVPRSTWCKCSDSDAVMEFMADDPRRKTMARAPANSALVPSPSSS